MKSIGKWWLTLSVIAGVPVALAGLPTKPVMTLEVAKAIVAVTEQQALKQQARVVIAVVDDGGHLLLLERLNDTQVASTEVAIGKARTASIFRRASGVFEEQVRNGRIAAVTLPGATPLQGGVPLVVDGKVVGAIGVSGESPGQDEQLALLGASSLAEAITKSTEIPPDSHESIHDKSGDSP